MSVCLSALQYYGCSPAREGPWGRSAAPTVTVLERLEGWRSGGISRGGRILRDGGKTAYLSLQGHLLSGRGMLVSGPGLRCCVCTVCLSFTLKRKERNGKLQMSSHKHTREAYKPDSSTFCPSTPQQAWWLDLYASFYYLAHLTFQPLWAFCVMYGPFSLLLNCFLYPNTCFT